MVFFSKKEDFFLKKALGDKERTIEKEKIKLCVLFGPPGSGKSSQALLLQEKLGWHYVSWGKISREIMNRYGRYKSCYKIVKKLTEENKPFPPGFIANFLDQEIKRMLRKNKEIKVIVLDGFPRRIQEAKELLDIVKSNNLSLGAVIKFNVNYETIKQRISERIFCPKCGRFYNKTIQPKKDGLCDNDGVRLVKRLDDYSETLEDRFDVYMEESLDAFIFLVRYAEISFDVDADQEEIALFAEIINKLKLKQKEFYRIYQRVGQTKLPTDFGDFDLVGYQNIINYEYHLILTKGNLRGKRNVPLRVHSSCITGDIFYSKKCDCGEQLQQALKYINDCGLGLVIYLFQEGRGINIINKIKTYELQSDGINTVEANERLGLPPELRQYGIVRDILFDLEIKSVALMTNNPDKISKLQSTGVIIESRVPLEIIPNQYNINYLKTKKEKMGHLFSSIKKVKQFNKRAFDNFELESKFLISLARISFLRKKILKIPNISYGGRFYEKTTMLDNSEETMNKEDARLRVRQISDRKDSQKFQIEFSYKRRIKADGGIKREEEIESSFTTDIDSLFRILNKMGYQVTTSYERYRETYNIKDTKITLDEFPFGYILEVEGNEEDINKMCKFLSLNIRDSYPLSCDDVYVDLCKKNKIKPKDHILFDDPKMPQFR